MRLSFLRGDPDMDADGLLSPGCGDLRFPGRFQPQVAVKVRFHHLAVVAAPDEVIQDVLLQQGILCGHVHLYPVILPHLQLQIVLRAEDGLARKGHVDGVDVFGRLHGPRFRGRGLAEEQAEAARGAHEIEAPLLKDVALGVPLPVLLQGQHAVHPLGPVGELAPQEGREVPVLVGGEVGEIIAGPVQQFFLLEAGPGSHGLVVGPESQLNGPGNIHPRQLQQVRQQEAPGRAEGGAASAAVAVDQLLGGKGPVIIIVQLLPVEGGLFKIGAAKIAHPDGDGVRGDGRPCPLGPEGEQQAAQDKARQKSPFHGARFPVEFASMASASSRLSSVP